MEITTYYEAPELASLDLVGTGTARACGATVYGTASHFESADRVHALCGVVLARDLDRDDWVSCARCIKAARGGK